MSLNTCLIFRGCCVLSVRNFQVLPLPPLMSPTLFGCSFALLDLDEKGGALSWWLGLFWSARSYSSNDPSDLGCRRTEYLLWVWLGSPSSCGSWLRQSVGGKDRCYRGNSFMVSRSFRKLNSDSSLVFRYSSLSLAFR